MTSSMITFTSLRCEMCGKPFICDTSPFDADRICHCHDRSGSVSISTSIIPLPVAKNPWADILLELPSIRALAEGILAQPKFKDLDARESRRLAENMIALCDAIKERAQ